MLSAEQVKPLLLHQDVPVRNLAVMYFREGQSRDAELVPLVLRACRQFGVEANFVELNACPQFHVSEESLDELLRMSAEANDQDLVWAVERILVETPGNVLLGRASAIRAATNISEEVLQRLEQRIDMAGWPSSKVWHELEGIDGRCDDEETYDNIDFTYVDNLLDALSRQDEPSEKFICDRLRSLAGAGRWQESFLVDLAGERRISRAIPLLLDCLLRDDEFLAERAVTALTKIGDPEAVRLIRLAFSEQPWKFQSHAAQVLSNIKHPDAEQAILELLETEEDPIIRAEFCVGLCQMFSKRGVEVVRREILNGYDPRLARLEERVLTVAQVLGIEVPEASQWRAELEEERRAREETEAELRKLQREYEARMARRAEHLGRRRPLDLVPEVDTTALKQLERPKVGRNEKCPCGSGKKYKKCCGRRS